MERMNAEEQTLTEIRAAIYQLPAAEREACEECADHIRRVVATAGGVGLMALALVGAENAAKP